jgi:hypothetical protein
MKIEVTEKVNDLERRVFTFYFHVRHSERPTLMFCGYAYQHKATNRHKWRDNIYWSAYSPRQSDIQGSEINVTPEVIDKAKALVKARIDELDVELPK